MKLFRRHYSMALVTFALLLMLPWLADRAGSRVLATGPAVGDGEWVTLSGGKDLDGWRQINGTAKYEIHDGTIVGTTVKGSPNSFLCTEKHYSDFELEFEVKVDSRLNSGVQIRSNSYLEYRKGRVHGYQVEIATGGGAGFIYDEARRGWLSKDRSDPEARQAFKKDQWNKYRVVCVGESMKTWINGVPVTDVTDSLTRTGFIGLQVHGFRGDPPAEVRWRNIRIRELESSGDVKPETPEDRMLQELIDAVEKSCVERRVPMIGREKAERLAELVRRARPRVVVECGTAIGYSALWIARELKRAGHGKLITIEVLPERAREAEGYFRQAGFEDIVTVEVGDAREIVKNMKGPVDLLFIDCGFQNYQQCFAGSEKKLRDGALVVADNAGIGASGMADYLKGVRGKYRSRTEWFDIDLPWVKRDAMEVSIVGLPPVSEGGDNVPPAGFEPIFNGRDFSGWKVPEGDGGHWKVVDGVIDYDAQSEARGDKSLWSVREFGDFVLHVDWRIKETPYVNPGVPYILPDGTHARDIHGKVMRLALPDSDSGIFLRGSGKNQVNIWCWPIGSGEFYGYRTDPRQSPETRAAVTPRTQADRPVGEWNRFEITLRGDRVTVVLNGKTVIENARLPGIAPKGRIALQHHGGKRNGKWAGPPSLLQFKNIHIRELGGDS